MRLNSSGVNQALPSRPSRESAPAPPKRNLGSDRVAPWYRDTLAARRRFKYPSARARMSKDFPPLPPRRAQLRQFLGELVEAVEDLLVPLELRRGLLRDERDG